MKNLKIKVSELLKGFINWLVKSYYYKVGKKTQKLVKFKKGSAVNYTMYMTLAIEDLGINPIDFKNYSTPGLLKSFLKSLEKSTTFKNRGEKLQSDIISAYNAYITYRIAITK